MNGTTTLRPAGSVPLYLPKRSTMPARACGTMRTVLASITMTNSSNSASRMRNSMGTSSGVETRDGVDVGGGAPDLEHLDGLAGLDDDVLVVRRGGPDLPRQLDPAVVEGGDLLGHHALLADQLAVAEPEVRAAIDPLHEAGADQAERAHRRRRRDEDLDHDMGVEGGGHHAGHRADGEHDQDQVEAEHLGHAQQDRQAEPGLPHVLAQPVVHAPTLSGGASPRTPSTHPAACLLCRRAAHRPSSWLSTSGIAKVADRLASVTTWSSSPEAITRPSRSSSAWVNPGGISSTWWDTSTVAGESASMASTESVETRSSRPPRSRPAA